MIWRTALLAVLLWALGFAVFMLSLGQSLDPARTTDGIVVLTGAPGRIDRGLELMQQHAAQRMLVSGVGEQVRPVELAAQYHAPKSLFACCIDLGHEAVDTRSNADETARWVRKHAYKTVRLVTSDWHMPRARLELAHALGKNVEVLGDPVRSHRPATSMLIREYHKYLVRWLALTIGFD